MKESKMERGDQPQTQQLLIEPPRDFRLVIVVSGSYSHLPMTYYGTRLQRLAKLLELAPQDLIAPLLQVWRQGSRGTLKVYRQYDVAEVRCRQANGLRPIFEGWHLFAIEK